MNNMINKYKSSAELKALAKEHLLGKYGTVVGATVVVFMIIEFVTFSCTAFLDQTTLIGVVLNYLITFVITVLTGLFTSGENYLYLKVSCDRPVMLNDIFYGFKLFPNKAVMIQLYLSVWIFVSMLPLTILSYLLVQDPKNSVLLLAYSLAGILCGIVALMISIIYSQVFFLLHDFPDYSVKRLLEMSRQLMKGSKGRFFYLTISFLPLFLLGFLSCGIAFLWLVPYMNATYSEFFLDLIKKSEPTA